MNHLILINDGIAIGREGAAERKIGIEFAVLLEGDDAQGVRFADFAAVGLKITLQQTEQRGLAAAVGAHQADAHSRGDGEVEIFEKGAAADGVGDAGQIDEPLGLAIRRGEINFGGGGTGPGIQRREFANHSVRFIDARLGFRGSRFGAAAQPGDFRVDAVREGVLPLSLRVEIRFFGLQKFAVIPEDAQIALGVEGVQLDHFGDHIFEKIAIVADHDARERRVLEDGFKPIDAGEVHVVGGLVEQQDIGALHKCRADRQTLAPAARERCGIRVEVGKTGAAQGFRGAGAPLGSGNLGTVESALEDGANRFISRKFGALRNLTEPGALTYGDGPTIGRNAARKDSEQRGFARAVGADQADAGAFGDGEGYLLKERSNAESLGESLGANYRSQFVRSSGARRPAVEESRKQWAQSADLQPRCFSIIPAAQYSASR